MMTLKDSLTGFSVIKSFRAETQIGRIFSEKVKEATRLIKLCKEKLYKADEEVKKVLEEWELMVEH